VQRRVAAARVRANTQRAHRESKWNQNLPRNVAASGRQTCRRRESLGADSRVLRLMRLFNAPENVFCAKNFLRCEVGCAGVVVCEKISREILLSRGIFSP
jgi:hypothetical protein